MSLNEFRYRLIFYSDPFPSKVVDRVDGVEPLVQEINRNPKAGGARKDNSMHEYQIFACLISIDCVVENM